MAKVQLWPGRVLTQVQSGRMAIFRGEKAVQSGKVFFEQVGVDGEGRFRPFGRRDDDPLHRARGVAGDVEAAQMRRLVLAGAHRALLVELAAQADGEFRLLRLPGREEERVPRQRIAGREDDALETL